MFTNQTLVHTIDNSENGVSFSEIDCDVSYFDKFPAIRVTSVFSPPPNLPSSTMIFAVYSTIVSLPFYLAVFGTVAFSIFIYINNWIQQRPNGIPHLQFKESALASYLLKRCRLLNRKFDPAWWLRNAHAQTILPYMFPSASAEFDREYLQMKDKGVVALDWVTHLYVHKRKRCTVLLVIPGLTSNAMGVSQMCNLAAHRGFIPVVYNQRGFGSSVLTTPKILSTGDPNDLRQVVKYIHGRYPRCLVTMLGYGTGCSLLLSYLGEFGSSANISAAACISACFDHNARFASGAQGLYDIVYLLKLKILLTTHAPSLAKYINFNCMLKTWTFKELDEIVYSKLYEFSNVEEFWDRNHPLRDVDEIAVPLLFINSLDDPFHSHIPIPYELCEYYPHFLMVTTQKGGHCGFIDNLGKVTWAEKLSLDYIDSVLEFTSKGYSIKYGKGRTRSTI